MIVDSSAVLAIMLGEPERDAFAVAISESRTARLSAASYLEVALKVDRIARRGGDPALDTTLDDLGIVLAPVTVEQAYAARDAFNRYGYQHPAKLNFGDCLVYALAKTSGEPLLFKGDDFTHTDLIPAIAPGGAPDHDQP